MSAKIARKTYYLKIKNQGNRSKVVKYIGTERRRTTKISNKEA